MAPADRLMEEHCRCGQVAPVSCSFPAIWAGAVAAKQPSLNVPRNTLNNSVSATTFSTTAEMQRALLGRPSSSGALICCCNTWTRPNTANRRTYSIPEVPVPGSPPVHLILRAHIAIGIVCYRNAVSFGHFQVFVCAVVRLFPGPNTVTAGTPLPEGQSEMLYGCSSIKSIRICFVAGVCILSKATDCRWPTLARASRLQ